MCIKNKLLIDNKSLCNCVDINYKQANEEDISSNFFNLINNYGRKFYFIRFN